MIELQLMLQYSCLYKELNSELAQQRHSLITKGLRNSRICCIICTVSLLLVCSLLTIVFGCKLSNSMSFLFITVTTMLFNLVSAVLLWQLLKLFRVARIEFKDEFKRELNQIRWYLLSIFATFLFRSGALWAVQFGHWPVFFRTFESNQFDLVRSSLFVFEFVFYDVIPIGYPCFIHLKNFKHNEAVIRAARSSDQITSNISASVVHFEASYCSESKVVEPSGLLGVFMLSKSFDNVTTAAERQSLTNSNATPYQS